MALSTNDTVALLRSGTTSLTGHFGKRPTFGRLVNAADPWTIEWENGNTTTGIPSEVLDKVVFGTSTAGTVTLVGSDGDAESGYYDCIKIAAYSRQPEGTGTITDYLLLKTINVSEAFLEVNAADVEDVSR